MEGGERSDGSAALDMSQSCTSSPVPRRRQTLIPECCWSTGDWVCQSGTACWPRSAREGWTGDEIAPRTTEARKVGERWSMLTLEEGRCWP